MRLLNTKTLKLHRFLGDEIPKYAILSHTWGKDEVLFQDMSKPAEQLAELTGYAKLWNCCAEANANKLEYAWIDTCCINSDSSADLSEAINSMYAWYKNSEACYAYLFDVDLEGRDWEKQFADCRWFTRGWTLQELLAPDRIIFFDRNWKRLGNKLSLSALIRSITGISIRKLFHPQVACIAQRMSWVAKRKTTRKEDIAYSLLGLFDVNMPLLYGEGEKKAFQRLQTEIIKISSDESIFAWTTSGLWSSGMLASSPAEYASSSNVTIPLNDSLFRLPYQLTNLGLEIRADIHMADTQQTHFMSFKECTAQIACKNSNRPIALHLLILKRVETSQDRVKDDFPGDAVLLAIRTRIDELAQYNSFELARSKPQILYNQRIFISEIKSPKAAFTRQIRAQTPQQLVNRSSQRTSPIFLFRFTSEYTETLYHLKHMETIDKEGNTEVVESIDEFEESASGLAVLNAVQRGLMLCWTAGDRRWRGEYVDDPCIELHTGVFDIKAIRGRFYDGEETPLVIRLGSRHAIPMTAGTLAWVSYEQSENQGQYCVDVDWAGAEGIKNFHRHQKEFHRHRKDRRIL